MVKGKTSKTRVMQNAGLDGIGMMLISAGALAAAANVIDGAVLIVLGVLVLAAKYYYRK